MTTQNLDGAKRRLLQKDSTAVQTQTRDDATNIFTEIAHALQTPLACLHGELSLLEQKTSKEVLPHIQHCERIIHNMSALIHNALYISRLEQSDFDVFMKDVSLSELLSEVVEYVSTLTAQRRIVFSSDIQEDVWIHGVPDKLEELVIAVLSNAIKYCKPRGKKTLSIALHAAGARAIIHVKDNGIGIPKEDLPNIFNRFYRTPLATAHTERGTGLGLAIAKKIADKHKATIHVESTPGEGTSVRVTFPCIKL